LSCAANLLLNSARLAIPRDRDHHVAASAIVPPCWPAAILSWQDPAEALRELNIRVRLWCRGIARASRRHHKEPSMAQQIITVLGPDRPGIVRALSQIVADNGGSWLESRMARLAGQFAGIVLIEAPDGLQQALAALERQGLSIVLQPAGLRPAADGGERLMLEVTGNDRPGIVRDVTAVLAQSGVNIEELTTTIEAAPVTGGVLFRAVARLLAPGPGAVEAAQAGLERLGDELMVDIRADQEPA
jgi:glycine cleavage system regulatory protein